MDERIIEKKLRYIYFNRDAENYLVALTAYKAFAEKMGVLYKEGCK